MNPEERILYPLKFIPEPFEGGRHLLSDLRACDSVTASGWLGGNTLSELMETYLERISGPVGFDYYGTQFPVSIREFSVSGEFPLLVNPDDTVAQERYDAFGRAALWYVVEAGKDAVIHSGFKEPLSGARLFEKAALGTLRESMNALKVKAGDAVVIAPGTVHGASGHLKIIEIAEASDLVFLMEEDAAEALDIINLEPSEPEILHGGVIADRPEFKVTERVLEAPLRYFSDEGRSFQLYVCLSGGAAVECRGDEGEAVTVRFAVGEILLVPADVEAFDLIPQENGARVLEIELPLRSETDSYING